MIFERGGIAEKYAAASFARDGKWPWWVVGKPPVHVHALGLKMQARLDADRECVKALDLEGDGYHGEWERIRG